MFPIPDSPPTTGGTQIPDGVQALDEALTPPEFVLIHSA